MKDSLVVLGVLLLWACSSTRVSQLEGGTRVPAAAGQVSSRVTENGNTYVDLKVEHLAEPGKVSPGAKTYVVWAQPNTGGNPVRNLGALKVNDDLKGELRTSTPFGDFHLFLTAETSPEAEKPTGEPLLWAEVMPK